MYKEERNRISEYYNTQLNKLGHFVAYEELSEIELHPAILRYISAEIDFLIYEDREKLLHNSSFDYSSDKISYYFSLISAEIRKRKRFPVEYISKLILHAVSFNLHYLAQPKSVLLKFVFEDHEKKSRKEIEQILNYIYHYPYIPRAVGSFIKKKNMNNVGISVFSDLLEKIDVISVRDYRTSMIETAVRSIGEFFCIGSDSGNSVSLEALKLYFREKDMEAELNALVDKFGERKLADVRETLNLFGIESELFGESDTSEETKKFIEEKELEIRRSMEEITKVEEEVKPEINKFVQEEVQNEIEEKFEEVEGISIVEETETPESSPETGEESTFKEEPAVEEEKLEDEEKSEIPAGVKLESGHTEEASLPEVIEEDSILEETSELEIDDGDDIEFVEEEPLGKEDDFYIDEPISDDFEETLFGDKDVTSAVDEPEIDTEESKPSTRDGFVNEEIIEKFEPKEDESDGIDVAKLIENKSMSKIIETVFDYDMQEFTNVIVEISECASAEEAEKKLDEIFEKYKIDSESKEGQSFRSIILEQFRNK